MLGIRVKRHKVKGPEHLPEIRRAGGEGVEVDLAEAMIEKEPVTIVLSEKGWIRAIRGHQTEPESLAFKEGDKLKSFGTPPA